MIYNIGNGGITIKKGNSMDAREAKERLSEIRFKYQHKMITREEAYKLAEEPLKIYNDKATEIAKKYGAKPKTLPNSIIFW